MARYRQKRLRYGLTSGVLAFCAGWAAITLLMSGEMLPEYPRWQTTLWAYLGAHFVTLSGVHTGGLGFNTVQPVELAGLPELVYLIPPIAVAIAAGYTCYSINITRIKFNVSNAIAAGMGYFLTGLVVMVATDIRPTVSMLLTIALVVGGGIWIGSQVLGFLTRGLPFLGVASLGGIFAIGLLVLLGGVAILSIIQGLVAVSFGAAAVTGFAVGVSRHLERRGGQNGRLPRIGGLKVLLEENWQSLSVAAIIAVALLFGLSQ